MASMFARSVGINLRNATEKARWKNLSPLTSQPSRYPSLAVTKGLGIQQCWNTLLQEGGLYHLFNDKRPSYKVLIVEFLSTLELIYSEQEEELEAIIFRLNNNEFSLTPVEFNGIFKVCGDEDGAIWQEPEEFDRDQFWQAIALQEDPSIRFNPSRAKISEIRNPILRYMHKVLLYLLFAHTEAGSVQTEELFVLWGLLRGVRINIGQLMIEFLERMSKKKS
ncbi:hypothetical protein AAHA92_02643 [Salvia divinorum]|uniref:Arabidopsis retrotransposon Orf1 C-terminal domain-containing protein n=1 Tax=Salvia divinorum TaxID=28513 RepID=A0ABD1IEJ3_SALDI